MKQILTGLALLATLGGQAPAYAEKPRDTPQQRVDMSSRTFLHLPSPQVLLDYVKSNGKRSTMDLSDDHYGAGSHCEDYDLKMTLSGQKVDVSLGTCYGEGFGNRDDSLVIQGQDEQGRYFFVNFAATGPSQHFLLQARVGNFDYLTAQDQGVRTRIEDGALEILRGIEQKILSDDKTRGK